MRHALLLPFALLPLLGGCADKTVTSLGRTGGAAPALMLTTQLLGSNGELIGTARLVQEADGTRVTATLAGLPPGSYAVHLHAIGRCEAPGFTSAGGHFNPAGRQHGSRNPAGDHAGDLPNVDVGADRRGSLDAVRPGLRLVGGTAPLVDADGAAVVVHAEPDDYLTDPTGNAGARLACGILSYGKPG
jgi:superoxide dismutase, Cu-Zn family